MNHQVASFTTDPNFGIRPHGGRLIHRITQANPAGLFSITIPEDLANDVENIADGIFSPLEGFLTQEDFEHVISSGRLANGTAWTIPIVLDVNQETAHKMKESGDVLLKTSDGTGIAILHVEDIYSFDKQKTYENIFGTKDTKHPGVAKVKSMREKLVGGKIDLIQRPPGTEIRSFRLTPVETRQAFFHAGWKSIVAFQTRNPPHVAHEMLQKNALFTGDGIFVNPLVGGKTSGDFVDDLVLKSYGIMISNYYPKNRCMLTTLHTGMRYAGPREAVHHAIVRQNYGCTHIIIGRDHAGIGNFYDLFEAHRIFDSYPDLEITPIFFPAFFYCKKCLAFTNEKACPHAVAAREQISGTQLRNMIKRNENPSHFLLRPEVSSFILDYEKPFVE